MKKLSSGKYNQLDSKSSLDRYYFKKDTVTEKPQLFVIS